MFVWRPAIADRSAARLSARPGAVTSTPFRRAPGGTSNHSRRTHSSYDGPFRSSRLSMPPVKKLLNVVEGCEIRGRLRCNAASIGYRNRIRKALIHSRVTLVSRNRCQGINLRLKSSHKPGPQGPARGFKSRWTTDHIPRRRPQHRSSKFRPYGCWISGPCGSECFALSHGLNRGRPESN